MKNWARGYLGGVDPRRVTDWVTRRLDVVVGRGGTEVNGNEPGIRLPGGIGYLDGLSQGVISGWGFSRSGAASELCLSIDGVLFRRFTPNLARPDVTAIHPEAPTYSGFSIDISRELQALESIGRSAADTVIAVTFDADMTAHIVGSPIRVKRALMARPSDAFDGVDASVATSDGTDSRLMIVPAANLSLRGSISAAVGPVGDPASFELATLDEEDIIRMQAGLDQLCALVIAGRNRVSVSIDVGSSAAAAYEMCALELLETLTGPALLARLTKLPVNDQLRRSLVAATTLLVQHRRLGGMYRRLAELTDEAARGSVSVDLLLTTVLDALWSARLWQMYAFTIERLASSIEPSSAKGSTLGTGQLLDLWTRTLRLALVFPHYFQDAPSVTDKMAALLLELKPALHELGDRRSSAIVGRDWLKLVILPCLAGLVERPALLRLLLMLDLRSAIARLSNGKVSSLRPITFATPLIESVFLYLEDLVEGASRSYSAEVAAKLKDVLVEVLQDSPLLQRIVAALDNPELELRFEDRPDQLVATFLVYSSRARRCEHSRLQALYSLATEIDTWRGVYAVEKARRAKLYSFRSAILGRPRVYMTYPHETLQDAMYQIGDDLAVLVDAESPESFPVPEMIVFDSVNLGQASRVGALTVALADAMRSEQDAGTLIFAPWLSLGGADAYCCTVANALAMHESISICLTESSLQDGSSRLRGDIRVVDLSPLLNGHHPDDQRYALAAALELVAPARIINFNSRLLWSCLRKYHNRLTQRCKIGCLFFCDDVDRDAVKHSYLRQNAGIFASPGLWAVGDTLAYFTSVCRELGIPEERTIAVHFPPLQAVTLAPSKVEYASTGRILWAGRLDAQKRLDVLAAVARARPNLQFDVYGFAMLDSDPKIVAELMALPNVCERGAYASFAEIDVNPYDALLVTTEWEGAPNIVLESAVRRVPLVAPRVGGISELLTNRRGFVVERFDDVDGYAEQLSQCVSDRREAAARSDALFEYVKQTHSWAALRSALARLE